MRWWRALFPRNPLKVRQRLTDPEAFAEMERRHNRLVERVDEIAERVRFLEKNGNGGRDATADDDR